MTHLSWPSEYSWTSREASDGTGGDMVPAEGTPVFWPSRPWQLMQCLEKRSRPFATVSPVEGRGFRSCRPPIVRCRLTPVTSAVSTRPGGVARQAVRSRSRAGAAPRSLPGRWTFISPFMRSFHDDRHVHVAVPLAAEVVADGGERARLPRRDGDFGRLARLDDRVDPERLHEEAVRHVLGGEADRHGLSLMQPDLLGVEFEALRGDLDDAWRPLSASRERPGDQEGGGGDHRDSR